MAVAALLYATQDAWIVDRRPVEDYPLGFAHYADDGWGTAQSRYLGKEVNGGRSGNHLADCLLTTDRQLYGAIRPAQLWRSEVWRKTPFDSIECPAFDGFLEPGPLTNENLLEWLLERPVRATVLTRLLSRLENPGAERVVITADDAEVVLRWIGAATLLLPMRQAIDISFKVFVNNLNAAAQRVVGVPKGLNPQIEVGRDATRFILDATSDTADDYPVTDRAVYWVARLMEADDPYDVIDAVELADALGGTDDRRPADTRETAWALSRPDVPLRDPTALARWITTSKPVDIQQHGTAVANRILENGGADAETLGWIEWQAGAGHLDVDRAALRTRLLAAEIELAHDGAHPPEGRLDPVELGEDVRRDAESMLSSAILLESDDDVIERLLRLARRHGVTLAFAPLQERLASFVDSWIAGSGRIWEPVEWVLSDEILTLLHARLTTEVAERGARDVLPILERVWPHLLRHKASVDDPLTWQLRAAALGTLPREARYEQIRDTFASIEGSANRVETLVGIQQALVDWRVLGERDSVTIVVMLPRDVPLNGAIAEHAVQAVLRLADRPDTLLLQALVTLAERAQMPSTRATDRLLRSNASVLRLVRLAERLRSAYDLHTLNDSLQEVAEASPLVVQLCLLDLVRLCLNTEVAELGSTLMGALGEYLPLRFLEIWTGEFDGGRALRAALYAVTWYEDARLSDKIRGEIAAGIGRRLLALPQHDRERWINQVAQRLSPTQVETWLSLTTTDDSRQRRARWSWERGN